MVTRFSVALSTAPNMETAANLARALVEEGLCACVNIIPAVRSIYLWDGEVCDGSEVMCVIKTRSDRIDALRERLVALHPYEVPELIVLDITDGNEAYLSWIDATCR